MLRDSPDSERKRAAATGRDNAREIHMRGSSSPSEGDIEENACCRQTCQGTDPNGLYRTETIQEGTSPQGRQADRRPCALSAGDRYSSRCGKHYEKDGMPWEMQMSPNQTADQSCTDPETTEKQHLSQANSVKAMAQHTGQTAGRAKGRFCGREKHVYISLPWCIR
ncbi:MAG: hypothetical protein HN976_31415 [Lentisphaerae bacterium]|nr:hypothetical protein [Lentisphaerota bacterium]MBT7059648.1 hypothetical protein [Lentisphaerota bacterium]